MVGGGGGDGGGAGGDGRALATKTVNRKVGSIQWLRDSPKEMYQAFYRAAKGAGAEKVAALCRREATARRTKQWGWALEGEFLPASVWDKRGWDAQTIVEKTLPEDQKICSKYGWKLYRVRVEREQEGELHESKDCFAILGKARTRGLRRRRTDDSEKPIKEGKSSSSEPSFSGASDDCGSSSEDARKTEKGSRKTEKGSRGTGKGKAKAKSGGKGDKAKSKIKVVAKISLKKMEAVLGRLRKTAANPLILEVEQDVTAPISKALKELGGIEKLIVKAISTGEDGFSQLVKDYDFAGLKEAEMVVVLLVVVVVVVRCRCWCWWWLVLVVVGAGAAAAIVGGIGRPRKS